MNPRNFLSALRIHFRDIGEELYSEGVFLAEYVFVSYHPAESRFLVQMKASTASYFINTGEFSIVAEDPEQDNRQVYARMLPSAAESIKEAKGSMGGQKEDGNFGFFALKVGLPLGTEFWRAIFEKHLGSFGLILNSIGYTKDIAGSVQNVSAACTQPLSPLPQPSTSTRLNRPATLPRHSAGAPRWLPAGGHGPLGQDAVAPQPHPLSGLRVRLQDLETVRRGARPLQGEGVLPLPPLLEARPALLRRRHLRPPARADGPRPGVIHRREQAVQVRHAPDRREGRRALLRGERSSED